MKADTKQETSDATLWAQPRQAPETSDDITLGRWRSATQAIALIAADQGWNKSEVARRADMAIGTFSGWYDGTYKGRYDVTSAKVENLIRQVNEEAEARASLPVDPDFLQSRVARELFEVFTYAQIMPTIGIATVVSGLGKTMAAEAYKASHPHVYLVTLSPSSSSPHTMKQEIGDALGLDTKYGATLKGAITETLKRDGFSALLIIDEAQNLTDECINELRHFRDQAKCGLVLLGNDEATTPYASRDIKHASAQVSRRVGYRMSIMRPYPEDLETFLDAWSLKGDDLRTMARKVMLKPGAFGTLSETLKLASMIAKGRDHIVTPEDIKNAYERRGGGVV